MTVRSQNGWPVLAAAGTTVIHAGGRSWRLAKGLPAVVFARFITRYAAEVEPITGGQLDDWSFAVRTVRGSTTVISNHASGTAIDINALDHQRGLRNTFTADQLRALDNLLRDFPVIRWGGAFGSVVDEMHFEICCSLADFVRWATDHPLTEAVTAGGISYHPNLEVDVPLTPADHAAIARAAAEEVWNRFTIAVQHPLTGEAQTIPMGTALGRAASVVRDGIAAGVLHDDDNLIDVVWNGATVRAQHPLTGEDQQITMAMAIGRAASVIRDGVHAGVLYAPSDPLDHEGVVVQGTTVPFEEVEEHSAAPGAADWETPLREMHQTLEFVAHVLTDPLTVPLTATDGATAREVSPQDLWRENLARGVQLTGLVTGMSKAISILATANAKGRTVDAVALHDAVVDAITETVPGVLTQSAPSSPSTVAATAASATGTEARA